MSNIQITQTETPNIVVTVDRGVAGVGIESVAIVYQNPTYYLEFTYTNGTTELVPLPVVATGVTSFNTRIGAVTLTSNDVTTALLSNSIANSKLVNSSITVNGAVISLGGSINVGTVTSVAATAGTGISVTGSPITTSGTLVVTNTAPDQVVSLTGAGTTSVSGTYPNFTITSNDSASGTVTSVAATVPSFLNVTGSPITTNGTLAIGYSGTALPVANGGTGATSAAAALTSLGAYPASNPNGYTSNTGTVTSVGGTGTVNGITLTGSVTTSGNLTLGGTLSGVNLATQVTGTLPPANGGTGITSLGAGVATFLGTPTSANLAAAVTNETGTGALVFGTSPTLTTPTITGGTVNPTTLQENGSPAVVQTDIGTAPNEIPLNQYLGNLAYQDAANIAGSLTARAINNTPIGATTASTGAFTTLTSTSDATINGVKVGRGGGSVSTNTAVGTNAINATATGAANTAVGTTALRDVTSGISNTALGASALIQNTTGDYNTALGSNAMFANTSGGSSVAIGFQSLYFNTTGAFNNAFGRAALNGNTTGANNTGIGSSALQAITTTSNNTAVGHSAGSAITSGAKNTLLGCYTGNQGGLDIRTLSNYVVLSDGDGNPRLYHNGTTIVIPSLPTSSAGLPTGGLWNDGGTLKVA